MTAAVANKRRQLRRDPTVPDADALIATLRRLGSKKVRDGMARYALPSHRAFGISVGTLRQLARRIGPNQSLAQALWKSGWYEARMMAIFLAEPARVTAAQMDRWCREFDNWAVCDTACFHLFDHLPRAMDKIEQWSRLSGEFQKRAAFALLASMALHRKELADEPFIELLPLIESAAADGRNFVNKAVSWALRSVGERSLNAHAAALIVARRIATSPDAATRRVGKDAARQLNSDAVLRRLTAKVRHTERR